MCSSYTPHQATAASISEDLHFCFVLLLKLEKSRGEFRGRKQQLFCLTTFLLHVIYLFHTAALPDTLPMVQPYLLELAQHELEFLLL